MDYTKMKEKFVQMLSQKGKTGYLLVVGIIGVLMITAGEFSSPLTEQNNPQSVSLADYKQQTEKELTAFLKEISGVGDVKVMITLESGQENIYAQQQKTTSSQKTDTAQTENVQSTYENQLVIIDSAQGDMALVEKTMQPAIQGVAVVCSGADDISVVAAVTNSVSVVLNVPTHKICVTKMR